MGQLATVKSIFSFSFHSVPHLLHHQTINQSLLFLISIYLLILFSNLKKLVSECVRVRRRLWRLSLQCECYMTKLDDEFLEKDTYNKKLDLELSFLFSKKMCKLGSKQKEPFVERGIMGGLLKQTRK